jgi:hypothetical protein
MDSLSESYVFALRTKNRYRLIGLESGFRSILFRIFLSEEEGSRTSAQIEKTRRKAVNLCKRIAKTLKQKETK